MLHVQNVYSALHNACQKRSKVPPVNVMVTVTESFGVNITQVVLKQNETCEPEVLFVLEYKHLLSIGLPNKHV